MNGLVDHEGFDRLFELSGEWSDEGDSDDFGRGDGIERGWLRLLIGRSGESFGEPCKIIGDFAHIFAPSRSFERGTRAVGGTD